MENRKLVKILFFVIFGLLFLDVKNSLAYGIDTHAFLTKDAIDFYSQKAATSSVNNLVDYLVDGSRREDDILRWMNHFYDPVYNRGLSQDSKIDPFYILGNWEKSKDWSISSDLQNEIKYKAPVTIASILTAIQQWKISSLTTETDFTWNEALYFWINGDKEKAMFALGHVLHLIQDASVPDHTRNDPHAEGSIYEKWAGQFTLNNPDNKLLPKLVNKNLIGLDNLSSYFDELAKYSNNNFYSKDTIGIQSGYDLPEPEYIAKEGDYFYGFKKDVEFGEYKIFLRESRGLFGVVIGTSGNTKLLVNKKDGDFVINDYWSLLSPKAVQYSASVIDFFFKEAERLKDDPQFAKKESFFAQAVDVARDLVSVVVDTVQNIVGVVKDNAQIADQNLLASVSLDENDGTVKSSEQEIIGPSLAAQLVKNDDVIDSNKSNEPNETNRSNMEELAAEEVETNLKQDNEQEIIRGASSSTPDELLKNVSETNIIQEPIVQTCSFQTTKTPTRQKLLINEVAWMGSVKSSSDEWFELKNISGSELDISNWQILDKEEQIKITFPKNTKVSAGGFLLLERTDDDSAPNVKADIIYTGALSNSDEGLRLFDSQCNLIDEAMASNDWLSGDSSAKKTMERQPDFSWSTYVGSGEGVGSELILGTPKKENSLRVISYGGGGGGAAIVAAVVETNNDSNTQPSKLLISEAQITGGAGKSNNDFIEIYNPNDSRVNLKGYRLVKRTKTGTTDTGIKSWTDDVYVEAKSFYLWANSDYADISVIPDITTSGSLANDNGVALRFGAEDTGTVIDSVAWGSAENSFIGAGVFSQNPGAGQSIHRKFQNNLFIDTDNNAGDFELTACPNPRAQSRFCAMSDTNESNQAPSAFFVFSTTTPKTGEEIIFNAASSTDPDGDIALYDWNFGDNQSASSTQATTTHSYLLAGDYNISLTIFDNLNATSTYTLPLSVASSTIQQDEELKNILISEIMPGVGEDKSDEEFVELYNPNNTAVDLTGYSLRKKTSAVATSSTPLVSTANFSNKIIPAKGFLLISSLNYSASSTADVIYSSASYGLANDNDQAVFLRNSAGETADEVYYVSIPDGKSLERKALSNNICVSAQGDGEFLGNGCDTDNINDFEIRNIPNSQNSQNFSEPRTKPITAANFIGEYDKANKKINLSWDASRDYSGATSTLNYLVSDISPSSVLSSIETASTTVEFNIAEIGRDYVFEIKAIDKEGLNSDISTTIVSVPGTSIEDVNYFLLNKTETSGTMSLSDRIFKPSATGVIDSMAFNVSVSYNQNIPGTSSDVDISLYEWLGSATITPELGRGRLLARSGARTVYSHTTSLTLNFSGENAAVLDSSRYYYFEINTTSSGLTIYWHPYIVIKAISTGTIEISSPIHNHVYENQNIDLSFKYLEPSNNKYDAVIVETRDFYTDAVVDNYRVDLEASQKTIGWHDLATTTRALMPGFYKTKITLVCSNSCESNVIENETYFSVFGAEPSAGKLLNQTAFSISSVVNSVAQTFRPAVSGQLDSMVLKLATGGNGWNNTSLKIYEWIGGQSNSSSGSKGQLLATSESKMFWNNTAVGEPSDFTWQFNDENEINLNSDNYYYLESAIDSQSNGGAPTLFFRGSSNDSLIDGKIYSGNIGGDLYLIINKKANN